MKSPVRVAITGAAGQISYALLFRIAAGDMLGKEQPVILQLLEIPPAMGALDGVVMELDDCAFPLLTDVVSGTDPRVIFGDVNFALLVGAKPRGLGMERKHLLSENAEIFSGQGRALNDSARRDVRVLVVGNPANTNALIASANAPNIDRGQFTAMTRLDHNRAVYQLANKLGVSTDVVQKVIIWGNHSATQYPDVFHARVRGETSNRPDRSGVVGIRFHTNGTTAGCGDTGGARFIERRIRRIRRYRSYANLGHGTADGEWASMAIPSDGSYGVEEGLISSFPVVCRQGQYSIVKELEIDPFSEERILKSAAELKEERDSVRNLL